MKLSNLKLKYKLLIPLIFSGIIITIILTTISKTFFLNSLHLSTKEQMSSLSTLIGNITVTIEKQSSLNRLINNIGAQRNIKSINLYSESPLKVIASNNNQFLEKNISSIKENKEIERIFSVYQSDNHFFNLDIKSRTSSYIAPLRVKTTNSIYYSKAIIDIEFDISEQFERIETRILFFNILIMVILLSFGLIAHLLNISLVFNPILNLLDAIKYRMHGVNSLVKIYSNDEIGEVANNYNHLLSVINKNEEKLSAILNNTTECILTLDTEGLINFYNRTTEITFGYSKQELIGEYSDILFSNSTLSSKISAIDKINYLSNVQELICKSKSGHEFRVELSFSEYSFDGKTLIILTIRDLSDKLRIENKIKESEKRYKLAVEGSNDGIWDWDLDTGKVYYSYKFRQMLNKEESRDNSFNFIKSSIHEEDLSYFLLSLDEAKESATPLNINCRINLGNNRYRWIKIKGNFYKDKDKDDKINRIAGSISDITDLVESQEEAESARKKAESALKVKSDFLAVMSHEIRTPLNGIIGVSQLLDQENLTAEQRNLLETLDVASDNLLNIINDILDFSKIESSGIALEILEVDLENIICNVCKGVFISVKRKNLHLNIDYEFNLPRKAKTDPTKLKQILTNFINNAIKFTDQGDITIQVKKAERNGVKLSVFDSGIGIPKEKQDSLFKEFSQVDSSTTRKYGGTGLGLAICKKIAESFNGKIGCNSEINVGSEFWIEIPNFFIESEKNWHPILGGKNIVIDMQSENFSKILEKDLSQLQGNTNIIDLNDAIVKDIDLIFIDYMHTSKIQNPKFKDIRIVVISDDISVKSDEFKILYHPFSRKDLYDFIINTVSKENNNSISTAEVKNIKVLIVDDVEINRKIMVNLLKKHNITSYDVSSSTKAIQLCKEIKFDLIFTDCVMPDIDGFELSKRIRKDSLNKQTPIVASTANDKATIEKDMLDSEMNAYIPKPFNKEDLKDLLEKFNLI